MAKSIEVFSRQDFLKKFISRGMTYRQAISSYDAMCEVFSDAVTAVAKINIGNVLSLNPVWKNPRSVNMGFKPTTGEVVKPKVFYLDKRLSYKVNIYKSFIATQHRHWFS